jgi:hypothetical protein
MLQSDNPASKGHLNHTEIKYYFFPKVPDHPEISGALCARRNALSSKQAFSPTFQIITLFEGRRIYCHPYLVSRLEHLHVSTK